MPWYLYLACKHLFPSGRLISFFAAMSVIGVAIGVGVLFGAMSVMNGFQLEIRESMKSTQGDIRVLPEDYLRDWKSVAQEVRSVPGVEVVNPVVEGVVMMVYEGRPAFPATMGLDVNASDYVIPFEKKNYLIKGSLEQLYDESVFVSVGMAAKLGLSVGSTVSVYTPLIAQKLEDEEVILPRELEVVGIFETGWGEVDKNTIVTTMRTMQDFYAYQHDEAQALLVRIESDASVDRVARDIEKTLGQSYRALTWLEQNDSFLMVLAFEKAMIFLVTVFIILVASFSIASMLLTSVISKTREIGLLGALGGNRLGVAAVFAAQAFFISITGLLVGLGGAYMALENINPILHTVFRSLGYEDALWQFYEFNDFPVHYSGTDLAIIVVATILLAILAGMIPAWRAAKMKPSEALRYE